MSVKVVIIAALEHEVAPLVKRWRVLDEDLGAAYRSFVHEGVLVVCAGIGSRAVLRATEKVLSRYSPEIVVSAGLAGALVPDVRVGQIVTPATIVNSATGDRIEIGQGGGVLVTASGIAGPEAKRLLARTHGGQIVDMEAAHVRDVARKYNLPFTAVKAVSDEFDFPVPELEPFVDSRGRFLTGKFVAHIALRPAMWGVVRQFSARSRVASQELCHSLRNLIEAGSWVTPGADSGISAPVKEGPRSR